MTHVAIRLQQLATHRRRQIPLFVDVEAAGALGDQFRECVSGLLARQSLV